MPRIGFKLVANGDLATLSLEPCSHEMLPVIEYLFAIRFYMLIFIAH